MHLFSKTLPGGGFALLLLLSALTASATESACEEPCRKPPSWFDFNVFALNVTDPNSKQGGSWNGWWDREGAEMYVDARTYDGQEERSGSILLVGGRVMAIKGNVAEAGYEIDALDAVVLEQKLVLILLGAALPDGTKGIQGIRKIVHSDATVGIQFATPSAEGFIAPPWRVTGTVNVISSDEVDYTLSLTSGSKATSKQEGAYFASNLSGHLSKTANAKLEDTMSLKDWNILGLGVQTKKSDTGSIYDYSAAASEDIYRTIADVRKKIAADLDPGTPGPSKDFTGFWKTKCGQAFGVSFAHYGPAGLYSIVFCGPGGCGDVEQGRKTYITGDKHFQVVSEVELIEIRNDGQRDRSIRCTKDPRPVLKFQDE
jgi:hypothetical protein